MGESQSGSKQAFAELNEVRKQNDALRVEIETLTAELQATVPEVSNLAGLDENYELSGTYAVDQHYAAESWKLRVTWGELFSAVGPHIIEKPHDIRMQSYFTSGVKHLCNTKNQSTRFRWTVNPEHYQTAKVQFAALKLVQVAMSGTINGGQSLFWGLTDKGRSVLNELRTVKSSAK